MLLIATLLVLATVGILGEVVGGSVVFGLVFAIVIASSARDWWRLRSSSETPRAVADRLALSIAVLALALAVPGLEAWTAWLATWPAWLAIWPVFWGL